jgi:hypothetical protein
MHQQMFFGSISSGKPPITFEFTASHNVVAEATSLTDSSAALGTAAENRQILVMTESGRSSGSGTSLVSGVTCGGDAMTELVQVNRTGGNPYRSCSAMYILAVPTGTAADIVVTWSDTQYNTWIHTVAVYGAASSAHDTGGTHGQGAGLVLSDTLNIPALGCAFASTSGSSGDLSNYAWVGLTEQTGTYSSELTIGSGRSGYAADTDMSAETGRTIQSTSTGSQNDATFCCISLAQA